jgi:hypothetical protein
MHVINPIVNELKYVISLAVLVVGLPNPDLAPQEALVCDDPEIRGRNPQKSLVKKKGGCVQNICGTMNSKLDCTLS